MAPTWGDKWGTKYDHAPSKKELEDSRLRSLQIPKIITQPTLNGDPCIDDLDTKTDDSPDIMKIILIGIVVGFILGAFK